MRTFNRYLSAHFIKGSFLVLLAFTGMMVLLDLIHQLSKIDSSVELNIAFYLALLKLPGIAYELIPISVLTGSLLSFTILVRQTELTVARALGYSRWNITVSILKTASFFIVLMIISGNFLAPAVEKYARQLKENMRPAAQTSDSNLWIRDGHNFIHAEYVLEGRYYNVIVYEYDNRHEQLLAITQADSMVADETQFVLTNLTVAQINDKQIYLLPLESKIIHRKTGSRLDVLQTADPKSLSIWNLYRHTRFLRENGLYADLYELELWKRLSDPLSVLAMLLLAIPLIFTQRHDSKVGLKVFLGMLAGLSYIILDRLVNGMVLFLEAAPFWGAFSVLFLFALAGSIRLREKSVISCVL